MNKLRAHFTDFFGSKCLLRSTIIFSSTLLISSCGFEQEIHAELESNNSAHRDVIGEYGGRRLLASGIELQSQHVNTVRHRISADTISIVPRGFGAFNLHDINEVLLENSHIEIFPVASENARNAGVDSIDFTGSIEDFLNRLPSDYGLISRVHIRNVSITLYGVGKNGIPVSVKARELIREFGDEAEPELYDVSFFDEHSENRLNIPRVRWNTRTGQFHVP